MRVHIMWINFHGECIHEIHRDILIYDDVAELIRGFAQSFSRVLVDIAV